MYAQDVLLTDNDLSVTNGDITIGYSDNQHTELILFSEKGNWRQFPLTGVGIARSLLGPIGYTEITALKHKIDAQLVYDGFSVEGVDIEKSGEIKISAKRLL